MAEAALDYARAVENQVVEGPLPDSLLVDARAAYEEAIRLGTPAERLLGHNNLGSLLLRQGRNAEALKQFRQLDALVAQASERFLYRYNFGRALELNELPDEAYKQYLSAVDDEPGFEPAIEGAFRLLHKSKPARVRDAADLATQLISKNEPKLAAFYIRESLKLWAAEPEAQRLLATLLRYYVAVPVYPPEFEGIEWPVLTDLRRRFKQLEPAITEIQVAYSGKFTPTFYPHDARLLFPA